MQNARQTFLHGPLPHRETVEFCSWGRLLPTPETSDACVRAHSKLCSLMSIILRWRFFIYDLLVDRQLDTIPFGAPWRTRDWLSGSTISVLYSSDHLATQLRFG